MNYSAIVNLQRFLVLSLLLLASCAPKTTFYVTKPAQLDVEGINFISIGPFDNDLNQEIALPAGTDAGKTTPDPLTPPITNFTSNQTAADLVRAMIVAGLSASNQYQIINTSLTDSEFTGVIPEPDKTGLITARVRYFEETIERSETHFFTLLATKGGGNLQEQLAMMAAKEASSAIAESARKGFNVQVPYVEIISAMEVEFGMNRIGSDQPIIPPQVFRSYFVRKWGGSSDHSHLDEPLRKIIVARYQANEKAEISLLRQISELEMAFMDPDEYLAQGGKLDRDLSVPKTPLEIRTRLAQSITEQFVKRISHYREETVLTIASGDKTAVTYIKANAYDLAINRLETIERTDKDSYNLGLAYESVAEYRQAAKYYHEALKKDPGNKTYQAAIKRING